MATYDGPKATIEVNTEADTITVSVTAPTIVWSKVDSFLRPLFEWTAIRAWSLYCEEKAEEE